MDSTVSFKIIYNLADTMKAISARCCENEDLDD